MRWSWRPIAALAAAGYLSVPLPLPTPPVLPTAALPTVVVTPPLPTAVATPSLPSITALPTQLPATAAPTQSAGGGSNVSGNPSAAGPPAANPGRGVAIPFTAIYVSSPLDIALLGALLTLPLLFGIWMLLFGRTMAEARRARDAQVRLMLAADLGLRPRDLTSMSTRSLFDLREKAAFDELTGVLRRVAGISAAEREIVRSRRHGSPLSVAFVDVDGLKEENASRGHTAGDATLRALAGALKDGLRADDVVLRYGGDEFVCVLPETTAKSARARLGAIQMEAARAGIRFCAGVAELRKSDDVVSLFARADGDLYEFKANRGEIVQLPTPDQPAKQDNERIVTA
ncbi:MAG TPA: GGDEF domain-containing protein [Candidatus Dormibacteraeota bacterium]